MSAPAHWNKRQAISAGAIVAVGALIFAYDQESHDWVARNQEESPWKQYHELGKTLEPLGLMDKTNPYWFAGIVVTYAFDQKPLMHVFQELLYSHLISGTSMVITRPLVGRARPRDDASPYEFNFGESGTSFPSGQTSTIFSLARVLSNTIQWWPASVVLYGMAGSVGYQRMAVTFDKETGEVKKDAAHWASDVWFGMWWGLSVTNVVIGNSEARANPQVQTGFDRATGALVVTCHYRF